MILRSILYGYLASIVAGLVVGIGGTTLNLSPNDIVTASVPIGIIFGLAGLSVPSLARFFAK